MQENKTAFYESRTMKLSVVTSFFFNFLDIS